MGSQGTMAGKAAKLIAGAVVLMLVAVSCGSGNEDALERSAAGIAVPSGWTLAQREMASSGGFCVFGCDSELVIGYDVAGDPPDSSVLGDLIHDAGWKVTDPDTGCAPKPNASGSAPYCQLSAIDADDDLRIDVRSRAGTGDGWRATIVLSQA
jgi:hypothetical protein